MLRREKEAKKKKKSSHTEMIFNQVSDVFTSNGHTCGAIREASFINLLNDLILM